MNVPWILHLILLPMVWCASVGERETTHTLKHTGRSTEYPNQLFKNVKQYVRTHFWWNRRNMNHDSFISLNKLEDTHDRTFELVLKSYKETGLVSNTNAAIQSGKEQFEDGKVATFGGTFLIDPKSMKYASEKLSILHSQNMLKNDQLHMGSISREINPQLMLMVKDDEPTIPQSVHHGETHIHAREMEDEQQSLNDIGTIPQSMHHGETDIHAREMHEVSDYEISDGRYDFQSLSIDTMPQSMHHASGCQDEKDQLRRGVNVPINIGVYIPQSMHHGKVARTVMEDEPHDVASNTKEYRRQIIETSNKSETTLNLPTTLTTNDIFSDISRVQWFKTGMSLLKNMPENPEKYFQNWQYTLSLFANDRLSKHIYNKNFPSLRLRNMVEEIYMSDVFEKLYWPFVYENAFMNQKLALLGLTGIETDAKEQKQEFYGALEKVQTLQISVSNHIVYSFNDPSVVDGLNRSGLMETTQVYIHEGQHIFNTHEQAVIEAKLGEAMELINKTMPELYRAIHQTIACIGFYKKENNSISGGTVSSALGLIWQDPSAYEEQSAEYYAEQIVHEYIHTSLFLADFVHNIFVDRNLLMKVKVYSPIRGKLRDFDKTFHATYVSIGLAVFHARCGNWEKAIKFAKPVRESMNGLIEMNNAVGVLNASGEAMLRAMDDFMTVMRLQM